MEKDWVELQIDKQHMWVTLSIKYPVGEENTFFSPEFIEAYLRENGITAGIDKEAIAALSTYAAYGKEVVVAKGKPAVNGRDGFFQFLIALEDEKAKPVMNEDGTVDYYNSLKLAMVNKDDVFAVYVPPTPGEYGYTVFSEMLAPVRGRELRPLRGKGFTVSEDGREYRAGFDGRIYKQDEKVIIDQLYVVKGDLDIEQGNIKFNGDVEIKGDVRSGLSIEAGGNIYVHGHVGGCQLMAGGKITIRKGIQGRDKCVIVAKNDVACSFIERCMIETEGSVYANSILDCDVSAKKQVCVNSQRGMIVGGTIYAMQGIVAKEVGNDTDITTHLRIGVLPEQTLKIYELEEKSEQNRKDMQLLDKNFKICESIEGSKRTKETEAIRMKIVRAKVVLAAEQKKIEEQLKILKEEAESARRDAKVRITGTVNAGTKISVGSESLLVKKSDRNVIFKLEGYRVVMKDAV